MINATNRGYLLSAVTTSDTEENKHDALYVGVGGTDYDLTVIASGDRSNTPVTLKNVATGYHFIAVKKVMQTGTTATDIVGLKVAR